MHDAGEGVRRPVGFQEREEVVPGGVGIAVVLEASLGLGGGQLGGAAVDDDGLAGGSRDFHLGDEGLVLDGDVGVFEVVVVEADFADGEAFGVFDEGG